MTEHHVGYLVKNIDKSYEIFKLLGYKKCSDVIYDEYRDIDVLFIENSENKKIELVSPKSDKSVVASLIKQHKNTPYHICYESSDFDADLSYLLSNGFMQIEEPAPAPAIENHIICYLINYNIGLVELLYLKEM